MSATLKRFYLSDNRECEQIAAQACSANNAVAAPKERLASSYSSKRSTRRMATLEKPPKLTRSNHLC
ncbi:hypothetical protein QLX08_009794 [Tetragonisca angustula]|uniref:Uncharacterized protein n=1 Tax=Tetragonisca angustula TaxID=166442 RepID=A0AAW0ZFE2_9HYME